MAELLWTSLGAAKPIMVLGRFPCAHEHFCVDDIRALIDDLADSSKLFFPKRIHLIYYLRYYEGSDGISVSVLDHRTCQVTCDMSYNTKWGPLVSRSDMVSALRVLLCMLVSPILSMSEADMVAAAADGDVDALVEVGQPIPPAAFEAAAANGHIDLLRAIADKTTPDVVAGAVLTALQPDHRYGRALDLVNGPVLDALLAGPGAATHPVLQAYAAVKSAMSSFAAEYGHAALHDSKLVFVWESVTDQ